MIFSFASAEKKRPPITRVIEIFLSHPAGNLFDFIITYESLICISTTITGPFKNGDGKTVIFRPPPPFSPYLQSMSFFRKIFSAILTVSGAYFRNLRCAFGAHLPYSTDMLLTVQTIEFTNLINRCHRFLEFTWATSPCSDDVIFE